MADDAQFDPLAGVMTPQMLQLARIQQQNQAMQAANADNTPVGAMIGGARAAGLSLGQGLGQLSGQNPNDLASQIAQQNAQILSMQPPQPDPSQGQSPTPQGAGAGAPGPTQGPAGAGPAPPADPYESRVQQYMAQAQAAHSKGFYDLAGKFVAAAQIARKQGQDAAKTQAEAYKDTSQGNEATSNQNEVKVVQRPDGTYGYVSVPKSGGTPTEIKGVNAPPPVPQTSIALKEAAPFVGQFAKELSTTSGVADTATQSLNMIHDMKDRAAAGLIAGTGSDFRQNLTTALETAGFTTSDGKLANTQAFQAEGLKMAMQMKASGMRLTQQEIQWFRAAQAGNLNYSPETLKVQLDLMQRAAEAQFAPYNTRAKAVAAMAAKDPSYLPVQTMYPPRDIPQYTPSTPAPAARSAAAPVFKDEASAAAAGLADGTPIVVNGVAGKWYKPKGAK